MAAESIVCQPSYVVYCWEVLRNHFDKTRVVQEAEFPEGLRCPLFVTWYKPPRRLRGCIGTFEPKDLKKGLKEFAKNSALRDHRFPPVSFSELDKLECHVSLLTNFEEAKDAFDWEIGVHGIRIKFGDRYTATYLPSVAKEQGWDKEQTLRSLIEKAGFTDTVTSDFFDTVKLTRYQASKCKLRYQDYLKEINEF